MAIILLFAGGLYINLDSIPVWIRWVSDISYLSFAYEGLCVNEFRTLEGGGPVIESLGFDADSIGPNVTYMIIIAFVHHAAALLVLVLKGPQYMKMTPPSRHIEAHSEAASKKDVEA